MTKRILYIFSLIGLIASTVSFNLISPKDTASVIVQFVARNGYGNNLYLDNISFGRKPDYDIAISSINNIPRDTTFLNGAFVYSLAPLVNVTNLGNNTITISPVYMKIGNVSYSSVDTVKNLLAGQTVVIEFDSLTIIPGTVYDITVYTEPLAGDSTATNDTLKQTSVFLTGAARNILAEEFTSMTSPSCAVNNPALNRYIDSNFQYICGVKYHVGFPSPGIDSLYLADSIQVNQRINYYFIYAVPSTFLDGRLRLPLPYTFDSNLTVPFNSRFITGAPLSVSVSDLRLPGDTVQATININLLHTLASTNLRLRVYAIERYKLYAVHPGTNSETNFYDIFRQAYPDSAGLLISNIAGNYQYVYKYQVQPGWTDSLIYTLAFVQDDNTKVVLNCGKSRQMPYYHKGIQNLKSTGTSFKADINKNYSPVHRKNEIKSRSKSGLVNLNLETFEGPFPPAGWTILNPDIGFTFQQLNNYNGPSFGGNNCIKVPFYDYPNIGEKDTLLSKSFSDINSLDTFRFDLSYAQYLSGFNDSLIVSLSIDGGQTFTPIFNEGGFYMATSPATTLSYAPISSTQWVTYIYPMINILPLNPVSPVPETYKLYQNYPNPFNPTTNFKFDLPHNVFVSIKIYDMLGREIITLVNEKMTAGQKIIPFTATNLASGIYFYKFTAGEFTDVKKMVFIK